jgi:uncharacterized protein (DUF2384 family)
MRRSMKTKTDRNYLSEMPWQTRLGHPRGFIWVVVFLLDIALVMIVLTRSQSDSTMTWLFILLGFILLLTITAIVRLVVTDEPLIYDVISMLDEVRSRDEAISAKQLELRLQLETAKLEAVHVRTVQKLLKPAVLKDSEVLIVKATEVLGSRDAAMRWLGTPVRGLDFATPISLLGTKDGTDRVSDVLGQMEHGVW